MTALFLLVVMMLVFLVILFVWPFMFGWLDGEHGSKRPHGWRGPWRRVYEMAYDLAKRM